ncbi:MAG: EF-P beta-lysylation protein EpmB, partial [Planctomycetota bacterium]
DPCSNDPCSNDPCSNDPCSNDPWSNDPWSNDPWGIIGGRTAAWLTADPSPLSPRVAVTTSRHYHLPAARWAPRQTTGWPGPESRTPRTRAPLIGSHGIGRQGAGYICSAARHPPTTQPLLSDTVSITGPNHMPIVTSEAQFVPIPRSREPRWQNAVKTAIRDPAELCARLDLPAAVQNAAQQAAEQFPLLVPLEYVRRIRMGDLDDPLLRQVLPLREEMERPCGFGRDPVGDTDAVICPGLLRKYPGRALLLPTPLCAIHCRYCFRRHFNYSSLPRTPAQWQPALDQLAGNPGLDEVILSGGDPLMLSDRRLKKLLHRLAAVPQLRRLRIHTRLPVVIPQRVTRSLLRILRDTRLAPIVVIQANHAAELDQAVFHATSRLLDAGIPVLNQSVLLRGVNDSVEVLVQLHQQLINHRVMPYYLHQLDRVAGAAHFHVPAETGQELVARLRCRLPGYAVPRFVREQAGNPFKVPLA